MEGERRRIKISKSFAVCAAVAAAAIVYVTLCPLSMRPRFGSPDTERFAAYAVLGLLAALTFRRQPWIALGLVVLGAAGLEAAQALIPSRHARFEDAVVKTVGGVLGVSCGYAIFPLRRVLRRFLGVDFR